MAQRQHLYSSLVAVAFLTAGCTGNDFSTNNGGSLVAQSAPAVGVTSTPAPVLPGAAPAVVAQTSAPVIQQPPVVVAGGVSATNPVVINSSAQSSAVGTGPQPLTVDCASAPPPDMVGAAGHNGSLDGNGGPTTVSCTAPAVVGGFNGANVGFGSPLSVSQGHPLHCCSVTNADVSRQNEKHIPGVLNNGQTQFICPPDAPVLFGYDGMYDSLGGGGINVAGSVYCGAIFVGGKQAHPLWDQLSTVDLRIPAYIASPISNQTSPQCPSGQIAVGVNQVVFGSTLFLLCAPFQF